MALERIIPDSPEAMPLFGKHIARYMFTYNFVQNKEVLDVGCGCGYGTKHIADSNAKKVIGLDIEKDAIDYAKIHYEKENLQYIVSDCKRVPFPNNNFDVIVAYELIEHLRAPEIFLDEMFRLLKDDGTFLVSTPNKATFSPNTDIYDSPNEFHVREYYYDQFVELLKSYFSKVEMFAEHNAPSYLRNVENMEIMSENMSNLDKEISNLRKEIDLSTMRIVDLICPKIIRKLIPQFVRDHFNKRLITQNDEKGIIPIVNQVELKINHVMKGIKSPIMNWTDIDINQYNPHNCLYFLAVCKK